MSARLIAAIPSGTISISASSTTKLWLTIIFPSCSRAQGCFFTHTPTYQSRGQTQQSVLTSASESYKFPNDCTSCKTTSRNIYFS